ncbi:ribulose-phosphate 3-epimerase [[Mycoplasma] falconis]|uniref:Ribulose-phosphate 3-epimerase n=1 Tax=[Mycoplasma] falconis TaxID=92403 RepID=A0A501X959_9BACT|nr:ribulose-phosphate 3-epimerase [[Mycoplasma] falconis]TPE57081.1 ribulose-phosphate 3-epimerase [[Mycoplasma] falconis]
MENKKISPSVLDVPKDKLISYVNQLVDWGVTNVHYDVMDNKFVPNTALTLEEISQVKNKCKKHVMDIHLMVENIFYYYDLYKNIGDILTFHLEAFKDVNDLVNLLAKAKIDNVKIGLAIKPETPVLKLVPYLNFISLALVMSVNPGFGGQKFIQSSYDKIQELKKELKNNNASEVIIQVDGGVNQDNIRYCFDAGVNLSVVGSYLVKNFSEQTIYDLLNK